MADVIIIINVSSVINSTVEIETQPSAPAYSGIMIQVRSGTRPLGAFRTQGKSISRPNAVGAEHELKCNDQAQVSSTRNPKGRTEGRWFNRDNLDLSLLTDLTCV